MASPLRYKRVILKVSGEALLGTQAFGIDDAVLGRIAKDIGDAVKAGAKVGIVTGGGNIFRGMHIQRAGGNRVAGDQMGMLATIMNAIALRQKLGEIGVPSRIFSAIAMPEICETYSQYAAEAAFEAGEVLLFAGGAGIPFVTTDSGAALRAAELGCDALLKATQVDGVYSADPKKHKDAERYETLTYDEVLAKGLQVMDVSAIALARDSGIPVVVFSIQEPGAVVKVLTGKGRATVVAAAS